MLSPSSIGSASPQYSNLSFTSINLEAPQARAEQGQFRLGFKQLKQAQSAVKSIKLPPKISPSIKTLRNLLENKCISQANILHWAAAFYIKWEHKDKKERVEGHNLVG